MGAVHSLARSAQFARQCNGGVGGNLLEVFWQRACHRDWGAGYWMRKCQGECVQCKWLHSATLGGPTGDGRKIHSIDRFANHWAAKFRHMRADLVQSSGFDFYI
jgi:hypothetical protein